jgi:uncharacterized membrane protein HdeD (DUF308 family)
METDELDTSQPPALAAADSWQTTLLLGVATLVLGLIVSFHPTTSLNVLAVLFGVLMIVSGIFQLIRAFARSESHRVWPGISGLLLIVIGVVLIRHLNLTVAAIGLLTGITWIVQGIAALAAGIPGGSREGRGWWILFGTVSLIAGIVVAATPVTSVRAIAVLIGIWFVIQGLCEIIAGFMLRHAVNTAKGTMVGPSSRTGEGATAR